MIDFSKYMTSETLLSKFSTMVTRRRVENIADGTEVCWTQRDYVAYEGDYSREDMMEWLSNLDRTKDWYVEIMYETELNAVATLKVPYTEEQVETAKAWIRDHPKPEVEHVTWRRHVPFNVEFKESYDD